MKIVLKGKLVTPSAYIKNMQILHFRVNNTAEIPRTKVNKHNKEEYMIGNIQIEG